MLSSLPTRPLLRPVVCLAGLGALLALLGCQGGDANPASPTAANRAPDAGPVGVRPAVALFGPDSATGLTALGLYDLTIDGAAGTADLTPTRSVQAVGDAYTLDLTSAFATNTFGCPSCLALDGVKYEDVGGIDTIALSFVANHPFKDSTTANRADLHINNARLVFLMNGTDSFFGGAIPTVTGDVELVRNADGYIALPPTFVAPPTGVTASLFPFKVFETGNNLTAPTGNFDQANGWNDNLADPQGYNVLKMGGSATTKAAFDLSGGSVSLAGKVALLGNFIVSAANKTQRNTPTYYMPEGAMPEAWHVEVTTPTTFTDDASPQADNVIVTVSDWQQGATVEAAFPTPTNLTGVKADGSVASVAVSIPAFAATAFGPVTTPSTGSGTLSDPLSYSISVTKPASVTTAGDYLVLAKITDARTNLTALKNDLTTPASLADIATYQVGTVTVIAGNVPPACAGYTINGAAPGPFQLPFSTVPMAITLDFAFDNDPDGTVANVDVDWSYDGVTFNVEGTRATAGTLSSPIPGPVTVGIRFTDDDLDSTICTFPVTVYTPATTLTPATTYIGPSQFSNVSANGSDMSVARVTKQIVSYGNNVYALCKQDISSATAGVTYLARSTDGGLTWPAANNIQLCPFVNSAAGPLATLKFNAVSMAVNSDGTSLAIVCINSSGGTSAGNVLLSRVNTATFTLDPAVRATMLEDATNTFGFDSTFNGFEAGIVAHPTNPEIMYVFSDDTTTRMVRLCRVSNFKSATLGGINVAGAISLARCAGTGNAMQVNGTTATSLFDPVAYMEPGNQAIHIVGQGGSGVPASGYMTYRKYNIATDTFEGAAETQFFMADAGENEREPGVVAWTDGKAIVVSRSDGPGGFDNGKITKAANATPPYNFAVAKNITPDWSTPQVANQEKPEIVIDRANGNVYISMCDTRDAPTESTANTSYSMWETMYDNNLNCLINGRKVDAPGLADNQDTDRTARVWLAQDGSPTTKRWIYYWQDASRKNVAGQPDLLTRTVQ